MRCKVTTIGCDNEYGQERVLFEDEQTRVTVRELHLSNLEELSELAEDVDRIEVSSTPFRTYDFDLTFICGNL